MVRDDPDRSRGHLHSGSMQRVLRNEDLATVERLEGGTNRPADIQRVGLGRRVLLCAQLPARYCDLAGLELMVCSMR